MAEEKLGEIFVEVKTKTDQMEKDIKALKAKVDKQAEDMGNSFAGKFGDKIKKIGAMIGVALGVEQVLNLGKAVIKTASDFEQLRTRLVSLYGSVNKAGEVFDIFKKVAATTPYSLKQVVEAGAGIKAFGMDAENSIKPVADLAAYMGIDIVEAAQAVGRAFAGGVGAADILRERGVLNLIKSFKGVDDLTKMTLPKFREALMQAMVDPALGIAGSTDRLSQTFSGAFSNMGDAIDVFAAAIGTKILPLFRGLASDIGNLFTAITPVQNGFEEASEKGANLKTKFEQLAFTVQDLGGKTTRTKDEQKLYQGALNDLMKEYPNYFKKFDLQKTSFDNIVTAISGARKELDNYISTMIKAAIAQDKMNEIVELGKKSFEATTKINDAKYQMQLREKEGTIDQKPKQNGFTMSSLAARGVGMTYRQMYQQAIDYNQKIIDDVENQTKALNAEVDKIGKVAIGTPPTTETKKKPDKPGADPKQIAKYKKDLKEYYDTVKFLDADYYGYREKEIKDEAKKLKAELGGKFDEEKFYYAKRKELADDYFNYLKDKYQGDTKATKLLDIIESGQVKSANSKPVNTGAEMTASSGFVVQPAIFEESTAQILEDWVGQNEVMKNSFNSVVDGVTSGLELVRFRARTNASEIENIFVNMANAILASFEQIIAKWAVLNVLSFAFGGPGIGLGEMLGFNKAGTGGSFVNAGGGNIKRLAGGGSMMVPGGFERDNYPLLVKTAERVDVLTPLQQMKEKKNQAALAQGIQDVAFGVQVLNANLTDTMNSPLKGEFAINGKISGRDIELANRKTSKLYKRIS